MLTCNVWPKCLLSYEQLFQLLRCNKPELLITILVQLYERGAVPMDLALTLLQVSTLFSPPVIQSISYTVISPEQNRLLNCKGSYSAWSLSFNGKQSVGKDVSVCGKKGKELWIKKHLNIKRFFNAALINS